VVVPGLNEVVQGSTCATSSRPRVSACSSFACFLTSPGRCEACSSVPPDNRSTASVAVADAPQRRWGTQGSATSSVSQSACASSAYRNLREFRAPEATYPALAAETLALRHRGTAGLALSIPSMSLDGDGRGT
jgi:hypothetical protein